ncbi:hypothetical protein I6G82_02710 [Lysinibacillus macroides]|nr:hypothetical protein I6G82_02710 [Lysinibacillus macroides]
MKYIPLNPRLRLLIVTPCMGVWIEMRRVAADREGATGHTLYGCVD